MIALAAHQILLQTYLLSSYFTDGIAVSANIIGANAVAQGDIRRLQTACRRLLHLGLLIGFLFSTIYGFGQDRIMKFFSQDPKVLAVGMTVWPLLVFTQPLSSLAFTYDGLMFGLGAFSQLRTHIVIATAFIFLPIALYAPSLEGLWVGIVAVNLYRTLALYVHTRRYFSNHNPHPA